MPWATWIANRCPQFKVHASLGQAKKALGASNGSASYDLDGFMVCRVRGGALYEISGDKWTVRAIIPPNTFKREHLLFAEPRKWRKAPGITTLITEHPY